MLITALRDCNALSPDTLNAHNLSTFVHIKNNQIHILKYFDTLHVSRITQILHNRIMIGCNSLNSHLFKKNLLTINSVHRAALKHILTSVVMS